MRLNELMEVRKDGKCSHMWSGRAYVQYTAILRSFPSSNRSGAIIIEKAWLYSSPERWLPKGLLFNLGTSQHKKKKDQYLCLRVKEQDAHAVLRTP
jgi:hypothetical protein